MRKFAATLPIPTGDLGRGTQTSFWGSSRVQRRPYALAWRVRRSGKNRAALQSPPSRTYTANLQSTGLISWQRNSTACHHTHSVVQFFLVAWPNVTSDHCTFFGLGPAHEATILTPCNHNSACRTSLLLLSKASQDSSVIADTSQLVRARMLYLGPNHRGHMPDIVSRTVANPPALFVYMQYWAYLVVALHLYSALE